jgi:DNA-binding protein H-NS
MNADDTPELGLEEIQAGLARVSVERLRLDEREKALLLALGRVSAQRLNVLSGQLQAKGLVMENVLKRTVNASAKKPRLDQSKLAQPFVRKAPVQFRHPEQAGLVWSGRGKTPLWVKELQAQGRLDTARVKA